MPTVRSMLARVFSPLRRAAEGQSRTGWHYLPVSGGWLPPGADWGWWQQGHSLLAGDRSAVVERCLALYSETIASLPGTHWRRNTRGGRTRVENSALSRILQRPNEYETTSSFMLNLVRSLYMEGNAFALALRNHRFEVDSLFLMNPRMSSPFIGNDGSVWFRLAGNAVAERVLGDKEFIVPRRDVLHVKLHSDYRSPHPLIGEPPLTAAMMDLAMSSAFTEQQLNFLKNQARPSAVLSTDLTLDRSQVEALRDRWADQSKGINQGGTPILTSGLKVVPWATPARDAQLAELMELSAKRICWAFGIPLQLLGLANTPATSTESLMRFWLSTGLGFALALVEESFDRLFNLEGEPIDYCEFSTDALLRSDPKDRIEMLVRGVQGGLYSPNEARNLESLDGVPFGDEPRVQSQVVPLSAASAIPTAPMPAVQPAAPAVMEDSYRGAVQRDVEAMRARNTERARSSGHAHLKRRAAKPRETVIGNAKANGHADTWYAEKSMQGIIAHERKMGG